MFFKSQTTSMRLHRSVLCANLPPERREIFTALFFRFSRITTCDHVFDHWGTVPSEIPKVVKFRNLHKSRANRFARRGNLTRVSGKLAQRTDLCRRVGHLERKRTRKIFQGRAAPILFTRATTTLLTRRPRCHRHYAAGPLK